MRIRNITRNYVLVENACLANTFWRRLKGLLGTSKLLTGEALIISPCSSVHTFGMRYAIDVLFLSEKNRVQKVVTHLGPGLLARGQGSRYVIELPAGTAAAAGIEIDDLLEISK